MQLSSCGWARGKCLITHFPLNTTNSQLERSSSYFLINSFCPNKTQMLTDAQVKHTNTHWGWCSAEALTSRSPTSKDQTSSLVSTFQTLIMPLMSPEATMEESWLNMAQVTESLWPVEIPHRFGNDLIIKSHRSFLAVVSCISKSYGDIIHHHTYLNVLAAQ